MLSSPLTILTSALGVLRRSYKRGNYMTIAEAIRLTECHPYIASDMIRIYISPHLLGFPSEKECLKANKRLVTKQGLYDNQEEWLERLMSSIRSDKRTRTDRALII